MDNRITLALVGNVGKRLKTVLVGPNVFGLTTHDGVGLISPYQKSPPYTVDWVVEFDRMSKALAEASDVEAN